MKITFKTKNNSRRISYGKKMTTALVIATTLAISNSLYAANNAVTHAESGQTGMTQNKPVATSDQQFKTEQGMSASSQIPSADKLKGMKVLSQSGEKVGEIIQVAKDEQNETIQYVTIEKGEILGMGGEKVAVPVEALRFGNEHATLTIDPSKLDNAPQKNTGLFERQFRDELQSYYGISPIWKQDSDEKKITPSQDSSSSQGSINSPRAHDTEESKSKY